jgi:hypothetical protein
MKTRYLFQVYDDCGTNIRNMFFINNIQIEDFETHHEVELKERHKEY